MAKEERAVLEDLFYGKNAFFFWFTQIAGLVLPIIILSFKRFRQSIKWVVAASVMVLLGALINRYLIVVPNMLHPFVPIQHAQHGYATYNPTLIEWTITASSLAGFVLLIILLFKPFPVITMWEVTEEVEKRGEKEIGVENIITLQNIPTHAS
jgi:molybdopterin-containing oxidoreductase family membrane subunit